MKLLHYFKTLYGYPRTFKLFLVRAAWQSLWMEYHLKLNNTTRFQKLLKNKEETVINNLKHRNQVIWMYKVMKILEKKAPWKPMCYNRALTAKKLLEAKGIETTLHVGFKKGTEDSDFEGHAWLTINGFFITGKIPQLAKYNKLKPILPLSNE